MEDGNFDEDFDDEDFDGEDFDDEGGDDGNDKPFDDEPFDAGVEADEDDDPKRFIQQLSGKLGQSLRKYTETNGAVDYDLEKFAINSLISATHTGEMDDEDQKDIIDKIKSSGKDNSSNEGGDVEDDIDVDNDPNQDVEDDEVDSELEENLINMSENLVDKKISSILSKKEIILNKLKEHHDMDYKNFGNYDKEEYMLDGPDISESPDISPAPVKPKEKPQIKPSRRSKPWRPNKQPKVNPKAEVDGGKVVNEYDASNGRVTSTKYLDNNRATLTTNFNGSEVDFHFKNSGEIIEEPKYTGGLTIYKYISVDSPDGKEYSIGVKFTGDDDSSMSVVGVNDEYVSN